jgi:DNA polymerase-1
LHDVLIVDIETNGLLDTLKTIHSLVLRDPATGWVGTYAAASHDFSGRTGIIELGLAKMREAKTLVAHNGIKFDERAIEMLYPGTLAKLAAAGVVWRDTIVLARLIWPEIRQQDFALINGKNPNFPRKLIGSQSLEAWGHRLGFQKTGLDVSFERWSLELQRRCEQDTLVTAELWKRVIARCPSRESVEIEHDFARIIMRQEESGFPFNEAAARSLYVDLSARRQEIEDELQKTMQPRWLPVGGIVTPKKTLNFKNRPGQTEGAPYQHVSLTTFNPSSRDHVASWLKQKYGWNPKTFTDDGKPKVDEQVLAGLKYPEAKLLKEHFLIQKRIGQIAEGKEAWLKLVKKGVIYGRMNTNGAVTGRCTHMNPNISQVPAAKSPYGKECRSLFGPWPGEKQVGVDAEGLELRCLGHYLAPYDGGAFARAVIEGKKEDETDVHSRNCKALGLEPKGIYVASGKQTTGRDLAKTFIYAVLYGAGDKKVAKILGMKLAEAKARKEKFLEQLGIGKLLRDVKGAVKKRGYLVGIDGRQLAIRSEHSALNTLLQSAGAIIVKKATVLFWKRGEAQGWASKVRPLTHVHDEWQVSSPIDPDGIGKQGAEAITEAGVLLKFKCPLAGDFKVGNNWYETH